MARIWPIVVTAVLCLPAAAAEPSKDALTFGSIAILAPLCQLRDNEWARDLRSAETQALTKSISRNDAVATLSYAEDEAAESFAEAKPQMTCGPLRRDPNLGKADEIVRKFREGAKV